MSKGNLEDDVKMLLGLPPYNEPSNICWNDNYFAEDLKRKYGSGKVSSMIDKLQGKPQVQEVNQETIQQPTKTKSQLLKEELSIYYGLNGLDNTNYKNSEYYNKIVNTYGAGMVRMMETALKVNIPVIVNTKKADIKPKVVNNNRKVRADVQTEVDEYLAEYYEMSILKKSLEQRRKVIEDYMKEKGITCIAGTERGTIEIIPTTRTEITSRFTTYSVSDVEPFLAGDDRKQCIVEVVDRDALEALVTLRKVNNKAISSKIQIPSTQFTAKP